MRNLLEMNKELSKAKLRSLKNAKEIAELEAAEVPVKSFIELVLADTNYVTVLAQGKPIENAAELQSAYDAAKLATELTATNRFTIIVNPGNFDFATNFAVDTDFIDIVCASNKTDIIFTGEGTINVTADDFYLQGINVLDKNFTVTTLGTAYIIKDCIGGENSFGGDGDDAAGTFKDCIGGFNSFGGFGGTASGTFENCVGANGSFGGGTASGTFKDCTGGDYSFGSGGIASGTFVNCVGGEFAYGSDSGSLTGKLYY